MSYGKHFKAKLLAAACLAVAWGLVFQTTVAEAGWLSAFTGSTVMTNGSTQGDVSFAVYQNSGGGNWETTLSVSPSSLLGGGTIDANAPYVYFYEVVNTGSTGITTFNVNSYNAPYSSAGYLSGQVFNSTPGAQAVGPTIPGLNQLASPPFISAGGTVAPDFARLGGVAFSNTASMNWISNVSAGAFSPVMFFTSNIGPTLSSGSVQSGVVQASGTIPTQAPEPGTLAIWGLGLAGVGLVAARRRQKAAA